MPGLQCGLRKRAGRGTGEVVQGRDDQSSAADIPDDARNLDNARDDNVIHNLQENATIITLLSLFHPAITYAWQCRSLCYLVCTGLPKGAGCEW